MTRVLLLSTYEQGHQPLGLAAPAAALRARGHVVDCVDVDVDAPEADLFAGAELIGISVPMHTAARLGVALARRVRGINPEATLVFYGLYAPGLHEYVVAADGSADVADAVIGGEYELALCELADRLGSGAASGERVAAGSVVGTGSSALYERQRYPTPDRRGLPSLEHYAHLDLGDEQRLAGYVEASRGCAHRCTHCPLTATYAGRLRLVQAETVLGDIEQQVAAGARHITFGDPDFFNAVDHSLSIVRSMHERHPAVTFDATIKVEHLIEQAERVPELGELGCVFVTSAFESVDDRLLTILEKGHTAADLETALAIAGAADLPIRPTWMAFTPWTTLEQFIAMLDFVERQDLVDHVQPVQYALRLLLPPGSPLIAPIDAEGMLDGFDVEGLTYRWRNPDASVDDLQRRIAAIVAEAASVDGEGTPVDDAATFARIRSEAMAAAQLPAVPAGGGVAHASAERRFVPRLTEAWFC